MFNKDELEAEFRAINTEEGKAIINRCQKYIEEQAESKCESSELKGMVRLLRHIKEARSDFEKARK
jgi:hypothetical protein